MRFYRLRLSGNPFEVVEPSRLLELVPAPPALRQIFDGEWRAVQFAGPPGAGRTLRLLLALRLLRERGLRTALASRGKDGRWTFTVPGDATAEVLGLDDVDRGGRAPALPPHPAGARLVLTSIRPVAVALDLADCRTFAMDTLPQDEIQSYYRARVEAVSTGPAGRFPLTRDALHRLQMLSQASYYRLNRILYQAFEGLVRDEPLEEKAIERGHGGFLLEEQESASARGVPPVLR